MDPWIRPFAIGIAPVLRTHCFVRIRKISGATVSRSASRRAFERPLPKALRELPFQKIALQSAVAADFSFLTFLSLRFAPESA
jgi:hypothetical protein